MKSDAYENRIYIICFTQKGHVLAQRIAENLDLQKSIINYCSKYNIEENYSSLDNWVKDYFRQDNILLFIGACGIAVRAIAPYVKSKSKDAGVIVIDEDSCFVIPILSGHIGGANEASQRIAGLLNAVPVLTTATDINDLFSVDVFATKNNLVIENISQIKDFSASLLKERKASIILDKNIFDHEFCCISNKEVPSGIEINGQNHNSCLISPYEKPCITDYLIRLVPKCLVVGIGCRKGKSFQELKYFVETIFNQYNLSRHAVCKIVSIDLKKDEECINSLSRELNVPFCFFSAQELLEIKQKCSSSDFVKAVTGVDNVCERSVYAAESDSIIVPKISSNGMTLCVGIKKVMCEF